MLDIELVTENAVEMIDKRDFLIVVRSKLCCRSLENRSRDVENVECRGLADRRECLDCLAMADTVEEDCCGFREDVSTRKEWPVRK